MKFMKLGSRPDTFFSSESVRSVSSEVSSDLVVQVNGTKYLLHKFPLLSKCLKLQKLCSESPESTQHQIIHLPDFPGGTESFELCAKFCYGIKITISAHNIVSARCAAERLQMTENVEKGNLVYKLDAFFNSCILNGWKDSIVTLQTTKCFQLWSEELGITSRCIEAIASKVISNPLKVNLSRNYPKQETDKDDISGWWGEDLSELGIDLYWRTMIVVKSCDKVSAKLVGDALRIYASKWLQNVSKNLENDQNSRLLLESVVSLLPIERTAVSCSFLSKLLKAANILGASSSSRAELAQRIGTQLDEATVQDLLIPSCSCSCSLNVMMTYDVEVVLTILEHFMLQSQSPLTSPPRVKGRFERWHRRSRSENNVDFEVQESRCSSTFHSSKIKVAKFVDGYLKEISKDVNMPLSKFFALVEVVPDFARLDHDDLYNAIDNYLKLHPNLNKTERKRVCRILDCKRLSMEVCMHAAQNELLPLRVVVQVLFFEQARSATAGGKLTDLPNNIKALLAAQDDSSRPQGSLTTNRSMGQPEDQWSVWGLKSQTSNLSTLRMKLEEDEDEGFHGEILKANISKVKRLCSLPNRPKRMFCKLWSTNRSASGEY
ncbi:BTB/POZ domain-containing protein At1g67900 [Helianthus annuus]|uniref:Putative phototropic-responsive NPH3 family protein n=1 Tax=Helianthus annuus TaxID=4232 RepID=A0A251RUT8_HELAN|nr:BTB/POZ domain-containing protein At1g67900 [Helianthus annuus]